MFSSIRAASRTTLSLQFTLCARDMTEHVPTQHLLVKQYAALMSGGTAPHCSAHRRTLRTTAAPCDLPLETKSSSACICPQAYGGVVNTSAYGSSSIYKSFVQSAFINNSVFSSNYSVQYPLCQPLPPSHASFPPTHSYLA